MSILAVIFGLTLAIEPAPADASDASEALQSALERVGNEEPADTIEALDAALTAVEQSPSLAGDPAVQAMLLEGRLSLSWLQLATGNEEGATLAMDEALRSARGRDIEAGKFGPAILELHDTRKAAMAEAGKGTIAVDCKVPCTVLIDEQESDNPEPGLALGNYRVWVGAQDGDPMWTYHEVELATPEATETLLFEGPAPVVAEPVDAPVENKPHKRILPRWASILGMGVGAGLMVGGAVLLSQNGKCVGGGDPTSCALIFDNTPQGLGLLGGGGAVFLTFGALLVVDEVRVGKAKGKQAVLSWSFRF